MFCFNYTKTSVNRIALFISIIIVIIFNLVLKSFDTITLNANIKEYYSNTNDVSFENFVESNEVDNNIYKNEVFENNVWQLEIPKINLLANIEEGTSVEILNRSIGHFEETEIIDGNVGLAAHNRGYAVNYFENIKSLELGDEIIYRYNDVEKHYMVNLITIIDDTEWEKLENTEDNRITLITCLENKPEYRRCIQGIEEK